MAVVQNFETMFKKLNIFGVATIENYVQNISLNCIIITVILINLNTHHTHEGHQAKLALLSSFENILPRMCTKMWEENQIHPRNFSVKLPHQLSGGL